MFDLLEKVEDFEVLMVFLFGDYYIDRGIDFVFECEIILVNIVVV